MPIRVLDNNGRGSLSDITAGIRYAVDNGADVINLSLGGGDYNANMFNAIQYASEQGTVVVMASGNSGAYMPGYPARYATDYGIAVGATDINGSRASFSNRAGTEVMNYVTAPGVNIYSSILNDSYTYWSGTSMATPHIAGIAALLESYDNTLGVEEVEEIIINSSSHYT